MIPTWALLTVLSAALAASVAGWMFGMMTVPRAVFFAALILPTHRFASWIESFMSAVEPSGGSD